MAVAALLGCAVLFLAYLKMRTAVLLSAGSLCAACGSPCYAINYMGENRFWCSA